MKLYNVAILGATGAVGQEMLKILEERNFPIKSLRLLASARSAGKTMQFKGEEITILEATKDSFEGMDIVLGAAENDIAMTVRSIVDAISVGESLDTAEYNYNGILTDGEGVPLYTDIQGNPGEWEVDVLSDNSVRIHNLYLGDLLPKDLMEYLTTALSLSESNLCASDEYEDDDETYLEVYNFGSGLIRFETREAYAPNGLEGPLMSIVITDEVTES